MPPVEEERSEAEPRSAFTPAMILVVRDGEARIHTRGRPPTAILDLPRAELLAAIAAHDEGITQSELLASVEAIASAHGVAPPHLRQMVQSLRFLRLFRALPHPARATTTTFGGRPAPLRDAASPPPGKGFHLNAPFVLRPAGDRFEHVGHGGDLRLRVDARELLALGPLTAPTHSDAAYDAQVALLGPHALSRAELDALLGRLAGAGVLSFVDLARVSAAELRGPRADVTSKHFERHAREQDRAELLERRADGRPRTRVIPVAFDLHIPLGLGLVTSYAKHLDGGRLTRDYSFRTDFVWAPDRFEEFTSRPAIYLFSNYVWSTERNLATSLRVKKKSPASLTIHGGPNSPRYRPDAEAFLHRNRHVDVLVHGEGEIALAEILTRLAGSFGDEGQRPDLGVLREVPGISFRLGEDVVHTLDRERISKVDDIPSPYLTGMFDGYLGLDNLRVTLETNRGCPYGCTFCDWGAATMTKVRQFDLERVKREIRWAADANAEQVFVADANFGIFARDVEIAQEIARCRKERGSPGVFSSSYAKNSIKHVRPIVEALTGAGLIAQGVLSFQTNDASTLEIIRRSNIKREKYEELARGMREARLPLVVELMFGLPGSTVASFKADLQQCMDRELVARANETYLLVNSPMNDRAYREAHGIVTAPASTPTDAPMIVATNTFSEADHAHMMRLRSFYEMCDHFAVLRLVSRFVRQERGIPEIDFFEQLLLAAPKHPEYPLLAFFANAGDELMAPPVSWRHLFGELRAYLVDVVGIEDGTPLDAVLEAQIALLPSPDRIVPERLSLPHDVVAWHTAMIETKHATEDGAWVDIVPRLGTYGPGTLEVDDPSGEIVRSMGYSPHASTQTLNWEYASPLGRHALYASERISSREFTRGVL